MHRREALRSLAVGALALAGSSAGVTGRPAARPDTGPLATVAVTDAAEAVVADGTAVFVATLDGFAVVDAADPLDLSVLARRTGLLDDRDDGPLSGIQDVSYDDDRLLVVGPAHPGDALAAAVLFDVSDPAAPELLAVYETDFAIHNCHLDGTVAYLTAHDPPGNPMVVVDFGGDPTERARWSPLDVAPAWRDVPTRLRPLHDLWVRDGVAALAYWDAGTWLLDVRDPAAPTHLGTVPAGSPEGLSSLEEGGIRPEALGPPGNHHTAVLSPDGSLLGIGAEAWPMSEGDEPGGITFYDVTDPTDPTLQGSIAAPASPDPGFDGVWTTAHNFGFAGGRCYSAWYQGGVRVHDVTDPADPRELFAWRDADRASFWTAQPAVSGEFFVASSHRAPRDSEVTEGVFTFPDLS